MQTRKQFCHLKHKIGMLRSKRSNSPQSCIVLWPDDADLLTTCPHPTHNQPKGRILGAVLDLGDRRRVGVNKRR